MKAKALAVEIMKRKWNILRCGCGSRQKAKSNGSFCFFFVYQFLLSHCHHYPVQKRKKLFIFFCSIIFSRYLLSVLLLCLLTPFLLWSRQLFVRFVVVAALLWLLFLPLVPFISFNIKWTVEENNNNKMKSFVLFYSLLFKLCSFYLLFVSSAYVFWT